MSRKPTQGKGSAVKKFPWATIGGYEFYEVMSAWQKAVRRGDEKMALYWSHELFLSNYASHLWSRLRVMASEDVGPTDSGVATLVRALYENWEQEKDNPLYQTHAVLALVRAPKSRLVDHATICAKLTIENKLSHPSIPDYALDKHTDKGRNMGRWWKFFREVGALLDQPNGVKPLPDPYEEKCFELLEKHEPLPKDLNGGVETK
jgi:replication-associated recombination protein RarA